MFLSLIDRKNMFTIKNQQSNVEKENFKIYIGTVKQLIFLGGRFILTFYFLPNDQLFNFQNVGKFQKLDLSKSFNLYMLYLVLK